MTARRPLSLVVPVTRGARIDCCGPRAAGITSSHRLVTAYWLPIYPT
jgi:hypothetical protein